MAQPLWRLAIAQPKPPRDRFKWLKRKSLWALPVVIGAATAAKYTPEHPVAELVANLLPEPTANAVSEIAQRIDAADPQYIVVVVAAVIYWANQERIAAAFMELVNMGIKSIIQRARDEVIAETRTKSHAEGHAEGRTEGHAEGRTEGHAEGRTEMLRELQAKAPPEIQDWLNQAGNDLNGNGRNYPNGGNGHRQT